MHIATVLPPNVGAFGPLPPDPRKDRFARFLVEHALDLRSGQTLHVCGEWIHRDLALRVGEAAFAVGGQIRYRLVDPAATAQLIRRGSQDQIALHHLEDQAWIHDVLRAGSAILILDGRTDPDLMPRLLREHPVSHHLFTREASAVGLDLTRRAIDQRLCPVATALCATPAWAARLFPALSEDEAFERLEAYLHSFTFTDHEDTISRAQASLASLARRAAHLNALAVREIHVIGAGNDFHLTLSPRARWRAATEETRSGQRFLPNVPSFEIFTTPDWRGAHGRLLASRPIRLPGGAMIEQLALHFRAGRVEHLEAARGADALNQWLDLDEGARRLGEIALVEDSPIAETGVVFGHPLLDENAASHIALGQSYAACLEGGASLTADELEELGVNSSAIHLDIPFGAKDVAMHVRLADDVEGLIL